MRGTFWRFGFLTLGLFACFLLLPSREVSANPSENKGPEPRLLPVWRALLLAYRSIDVNYTDQKGQKRRFTHQLSEEEIRQATQSFRGFPPQVYDYSNGEALVQYDIVYPTRTIRSVTGYGKNVYWISPTDTKPELSKLAPRGLYDSILVLAPMNNHAAREGVPSGGWGLAIGPTTWSNDATYCTVANAPAWMWNEPRPGEVWLHEWLHGVSDHFTRKGFAIPAGNADGGGSHGYKHSPTEGWGRFYRDLMTGQVEEKGRRKGITAQAWRTGAILGSKSLVFADYFSFDTLSRYQVTGKAAWKGGKASCLALGDSSNRDNTLLLPLNLQKRATITVRVQVPASGAGEDDCIGLVLSNGRIRYQALLTYGPGEHQDTVSFQPGKSWGPSHSMKLVPGWYTIKLFIDPGQIMSLKAWPDGINEPEAWQVTGKLAGSGQITQVGLRHSGSGTLVDDFLVVQPGKGAK